MRSAGPGISGRTDRMLNTYPLDDLSPEARYQAQRDIAQIVARYQAVGRVKLRHAEVLREYDLIAHDLEGLKGQALAVAQGQLDVLGRMVDAYAAELIALQRTAA